MLYAEAVGAQQTSPCLHGLIGSSNIARSLVVRLPGPNDPIEIGKCFKLQNSVASVLFGGFGGKF